MLSQIVQISASEIAQKWQFSERSFQRGVKRLESDGFIKVLHTGGKGRKDVNSYYFDDLKGGQFTYLTKDFIESKAFKSLKGVNSIKVLLKFYSIRDMKKDSDGKYHLETVQSVESFPVIGEQLAAPAASIRDHF